MVLKSPPLYRPKQFFPEANPQSQSALRNWCNQIFLNVSQLSPRKRFQWFEQKQHEAAGFDRDKVVGANGFEPSTSWSRTKNNLIDSVSLILNLTTFSLPQLDPTMDPSICSTFMPSTRMGPKLSF